MIKESYDFLMNLNDILKPSKTKEQKVLYIRSRSDWGNEFLLRYNSANALVASRCQHDIL